MPFLSFPYFRDRVCNEALPFPNIVCTSAFNKSPSFKKLRICNSSLSLFRRNTPPGKLTDPSIKTASCFAPMSTFHLLLPTSVIRPTTWSPVSGWYLPLSEITLNNRFTRSTFPATEENVWSSRKYVPWPFIQTGSSVINSPGVTMLLSSSDISTSESTCELVGFAMLMISATSILTRDENFRMRFCLRLFHFINKTDRRLWMMSKFGPPVNRSMTELDRSFFCKKVPLVAAAFSDPTKLGLFVKECRKDILYMPSIKHIVPLGATKGVLMRDDVDLESYKLQLEPKTLDKIAEYGITLQPYEFTMDYSFWRADDILRAVLPEDLLEEVPTGFAQAGHVAHLNLRDEFKPYKNLIGQVILDKNPKVETVVDKVDTIDTKFRTFKMEVLAGKDDLLVEQSEGGCKFKFDFSKVYWNSRLNTEHERLISNFKTGEAVGDVFAGVGPFAVPAGKKNVFVLANDLNPESYKYLQENIKINKTSGFVQSFNLDGREFIRKAPRLLLDWANDVEAVEQKKLVKKRKISQNEPAQYSIVRHEIPKFYKNFVMNLPDSALTFLDEFVGLYGDEDIQKELRSLENFELPIINVHCFEKFSPQEQPEPSLEDLHHRIHAKIIKLIDYEIPFDQLSFHLVRKVAPTKPMFCVTFKLPEEVAFRKRS